VTSPGAPTCPACQKPVGEDDLFAVECERCKMRSHGPCWRERGGCGSYFCEPAARVALRDDVPRLVITAAEARAVREEELVPGRGAARCASSATDPGPPPPDLPPPFSRAAIAGFVVALLGIPVYGCGLGPIAAVLGIVALAGTGRGAESRRGTGLAAAAIVLGCLEFVGWIVGFYVLDALPGWVS